MRILDRYLLLHVLAGTALALLVLVSLDGLFGFLKELEDVGRGGYGHGQALLYVLLTLPARAYQYAPPAVLIGSLMSLGALAAQNELLAIRAAGLSVWGIAASVLKAGLIMAVAVLLLGEQLAPLGQEKGRQLRTQAISGRLAVQSTGGVWMRAGDEFIQARAVLGGERLLDVRVFRFDDGRRLREVLAAASAEGSDGQWRLREVRRLVVGRETVRRERLDTLDWPTRISDEMLAVLRVDPGDMRARDLYTYVRYLRANRLDSRQYELAFWNRFVTPLSSLVMLLLALPFVFGSQRSGGAGQRLFLGVLLGLGYFLAARLLNQAGLVLGLPPLLSAVAPPAAFLGLAVALLRRV